MLRCYHVVFLSMAFVASDAVGQSVCAKLCDERYMRAASAGVVRYELERGAEVDARDKHGATALHWAVRVNEDPGVAAALLDEGAGWISAFCGLCGSVTALFLGGGAEVDAEDFSNQTPLHWAALYNENPDVAALLLGRGANPHLRDKYGRTPLQATEFNDNDLVADLLRDEYGVEE